MDEIHEKVLGFLARFASPEEQDIQDFVDDVAAQNPSLDAAKFKKNLIKLIKQANEIIACEKEFSSLSEEVPFYNELKTALDEAKEGQKNLEDISENLRTAKKLLKSLKGSKSKKKVKDKIKLPEEIGAVEEVAGKPTEVNVPEETEEIRVEEEIRVVEEVAGKPTEVKAPEETTKSEPHKEKDEKPRQPESMENLLLRLDTDKASTQEIIKEQLTPEKQAVVELLDKKKQPENFFGKIKAFFAKETEDIEAYDPVIHGPLVTFEGMDGYNEVERYWVNEPYALVVILLNPEKNTYLYNVVEPKLSDFEDLFLREIKDRLKDVLLVENIRSEEDKDKILSNKVRELIKEYSIDIGILTLGKILYYTRRDFIKFGKIDPLMHDGRIEDISSNGHDIPIYLYHRKYTNIPTNIYYIENELNSYVIRLAQRCGKHISVAEPMVDATMPDGSRIQMTLGTEVTSHGATFTIRKFSDVPITPIDLINWNTFSAEEMAYLWLCIENNKSLIFAGGTASGKTSSLNAVSLFIPPQAKIVSLEDTRELKLPHPNWIPGVTRDSFSTDGRGSIDMYELLRAALRQRPEYLLVGEVRGKEALTLFQAMSTGHTTFSTMHADSVASAIHRLENPPISVPRTMIQALNIISIQAQTYVKGKRARRNMKLVEIMDIDPTTRNIRTNDIFAWDSLTDKFNRVGESKALNEIMIRRGWTILDLKNELRNRQKILEYLINNKITDFNAISTIIHDYHVTPDKVLKKLNITG